MSENKIKGNDFFVAYDGRVIGCSTSCTLTLVGEFKGVAPRIDVRAKEQVFDRYSWTATCDSLVALNPDLTNIPQALVAGASVRLIFAAKLNGRTAAQFVGDAYISSYEVTGSIGTMATSRVSFVGNGPLVPASAITDGDEGL